MKSLKWIFIIAIVLCFVSSLSFAQDVNRKGSCKADIEKFCKDAKPGYGLSLQCLKRHDAQLSSACKNHVAEIKEKTRAFGRACRPDAQKFCSNVKVGQGRVYRCLKQHESELSANCGDHVK